MELALCSSNSVDLGFQEGAEHGENDLKLSNAPIIEREAEPCLTRLSVYQWAKSRAAPWPATRPLAKQALSR